MRGHAAGACRSSAVVARLHVQYDGVECGGVQGHGVPGHWRGRRGRAHTLGLPWGVLLPATAQASTWHTA